MKIYISGKISELQIREVVKKFKRAKEFLILKGYDPISPIDITTIEENKDWTDYMVEDIAALMRCESIYMLKDWGQSKGARLEYQIAKELELRILFEGAFNKDTE